MTRAEREYGDYATEHKCVNSDTEQAYLAGFKKALELAASLVENSKGRDADNVAEAIRNLDK